LLQKAENKNEIWVKKPYVVVTHIRPVKKEKYHQRKKEEVRYEKI